MWTISCSPDRPVLELNSLKNSWCYWNICCLYIYLVAYTVVAFIVTSEAHACHVLIINSLLFHIAIFWLCKSKRPCFPTSVVLKSDQNISPYYRNKSIRLKFTGDVMVITLVTSEVDREVEPRSGIIKDFKIGICCFSDKHAALRNTGWLGIRIMCEYHVFVE